MTNFIQVKNYQLNNQKILSFTIEENETILLKGPSGLGKTTLLKSIAGLLPYNGEILYKNQIIKNLHPDFKIVLQEPILFDGLSVLENLIIPQIQIMKKKKTEAINDARELLSFFNLLSLENAHKVSGGEAQRISFIRAILMRPKILLLDEPTSALDLKSKKVFLGAVNEFQGTKIIATHDQDVFNLIAGKVIDLSII